MSKKLEFLGCNTVEDASGTIHSSAYKMGRMNIVMSRGDFSFELDDTVGPDSEVLIISFSGRKLFPQEDIEYVLNHLGFDLLARYYSFSRTSADPLSLKPVDIFYYEQIQKKKNNS